MIEAHAIVRLVDHGGFLGFALNLCLIQAFEISMLAPHFEMAESLMDFQRLALNRYIIYVGEKYSFSEVRW
jgi:hypothetical protein